MAYYIKELSNAVDIREVLTLYGLMQGRKKVHCPDREHEDKNPSASIMKGSNRCYCHACARGFDPIDVIMQQERVNLPQACEMLMETFHLRREDYVEEWQKEADEEKTFPLSVRELAMLRWNMGMSRMDLGEGGKLEDVPTLRDFYEENREGFYENLWERFLYERDRHLSMFHLCNRAEDFYADAITSICPMWKAEELHRRFSEAKTDSPDLYGKLRDKQKDVLNLYSALSEFRGLIDKELPNLERLMDIERQIPDSYKVGDFTDYRDKVASFTEYANPLKTFILFHQLEDGVPYEHYYGKPDREKKLEPVLKPVEREEEYLLEGR